MGRCEETSFTDCTHEIFGLAPGVLVLFLFWFEREGKRGWQRVGEEKREV